MKGDCAARAELQLHFLADIGSGRRLKFVLDSSFLYRAGSARRPFYALVQLLEFTLIAQPHTPAAAVVQFARRRRASAIDGFMTAVLARAMPLPFNFRVYLERPPRRRPSVHEEEAKRMQCERSARTRQESAVYARRSKEQ